MVIKESLWRQIGRILFPNEFKHSDSYMDVISERNKYKSIFMSLQEENAKQAEHIEELNTFISDMKSEHKDLAIESYLSEHYTEVPQESDAYQAKFFVGTVAIDMTPNETIMPNAFEIIRARRDIKVSDNHYTYCKRVGDYVANEMFWVSDMDTSGNQDNWPYASIALKMVKEDCESHACVVSSIYPEIAMARGYAGKTYHMFNVFVHNDKLYILETNNVKDIMSCKIYEYANQSFYKIDMIYTPTKTFRASDYIPIMGKKAKI